MRERCGRFLAPHVHAPGVSGIALREREKEKREIGATYLKDGGFEGHSGI